MTPSWSWMRLRAWARFWPWFRSGWWPLTILLLFFLFLLLWNSFWRYFLSIWHRFNFRYFQDITVELQFWSLNLWFATGLTIKRISINKAEIRTYWQIYLQVFLNSILHLSQKLAIFACMCHWHQLPNGWLQLKKILTLFSFHFQPNVCKVFQHCKKNCLLIFSVKQAKQVLY